MDLPIPSPQEIRAGRLACGLTMQEACDLSDVAHQPTWAAYESGNRRMAASRWLLFQLRTDQHPRYRLVPRRGA
ncbi:hypothetical protein [Variovorax sp. HW608]|uniref:hypothetical protein n=1 Tax=Variovorax sp. HW608 TaxID=1034889 RepID=UPI0012FD60A0|nr:hypothetical protein [Variovorax sp. HW608]